MSSGRSARVAARRRRTRASRSPRSEEARLAVLRAVDDLLEETGYAAMTMKGIAERAGVGRQTIYRWWSTKAVILMEACVADAEEELTVEGGGDATAVLTRYVDALIAFLGGSAAGAAYRALIGEAQHDRVVADLVAEHDVLGASARRALELAVLAADEPTVSGLVAPVFYCVLTGRNPDRIDVAGLVAGLLG